MEWINTILVFFSTLIVDPKIVAPNSSGWFGASDWHTTENGLEYEAQSREVVSKCKANPKAQLMLPMLMQGVHEVYLDGVMVAHTGDREHEYASFLYNSLNVDCKLLTDGDLVTWKVYTSTQSLAVIQEMPVVGETFLSDQLFNRTLTAATGVALPILGAIFSFMFWGKVSRRSIISFILSCLGLGTFFVLAVPDYFNIVDSPFFIHRLGDAVLWIGCIFVALFFRDMRIIPRWLFIVQSTASVIGVLIIGLSSDLDQSQFGSGICFLGNLLMCTVITMRCIHAAFRRQLKLGQILQVVAALLFSVSGTNDMLLVFGFTNSVCLFPIGTFATIALMALSVNAKIAETYRERDYLRANLEKEVERKTSDLKAKSEDLERTLLTLKEAQAELVHSAKLASLGTLAAGIAHEINNSLNYVNGSLKPLQQILEKTEISDQDRSKAGKLLALMNEGLTLTFNIIINLKRHASGSGTEHEDVNLKEAIDGAVVLLRGRMNRQVQLNVNIPENLTVRAQRVSLGQVFVNLISNAIEAMESNPENKPRKIEITATEDNGRQCIAIADTGPGIPEAILDRIFDPFFTTKAVGKGTGLGLHIVRAELGRFGASISVKASNEGTVFRIEFNHSDSEKVAA